MHLQRYTPKLLLGGSVQVLRRGWSMGPTIESHRVWSAWLPKPHTPKPEPSLHGRQRLRDRLEEAVSTKYGGIQGLVSSP